jgi:hypothetical protein
MSRQELDNIVDWMITKGVTHFYGNRLVHKVEALFNNVKAFKHGVYHQSTMFKKQFVDYYYCDHYHNNHKLHFTKHVLDPDIYSTVTLTKFRSKETENDK